MSRLSDAAVYAVNNGEKSFCKFLSANDTGLTGGHQAGIYVSKPSVPVIFNEPGVKGENKDKRVKIRWQNDFVTDTRFVYYGKGTRNEYRITNFGKGFELLNAEYTGALLVITKDNDEEYQGFVLNTEAEINHFLNAFGMSPADTNRIILMSGVDSETVERAAIYDFISKLDVDFPSSELMSEAARKIQNEAYDHLEYIVSNPDKKLIDWTNMEFSLFKAVEQLRYGSRIKEGFDSVDEFTALASQVMNRRKSRAGKSLEHHLSALFDGNNLLYTSQAVTEGNKKPDFIFPSQEAYHDFEFPVEKIISLAAKTTCKDRWRQILNEADRLKGRQKFLCTLQQGITPAQMDEMQAEQVALVVPKPYIATYPADRQDRIWDVRKFIEYVKEVEK